MYGVYYKANNNEMEKPVFWREVETVEQAEVSISQYPTGFTFFLVQGTIPFPNELDLCK